MALRVKKIVSRNDMKGFRALLYKRDFHIDQKDKDDVTALQYAIKQNQIEMAKFLLERGADVNLPSRQCTSLYLAIQFSGIDMVKLILPYVNEINERSPLYCLKKIVKTPLYNSIKLNKLDMAKLLLQRNADANIDRPLQLALEKKNVGAIELLLRHGADPNLKIGWNDNTIVFHSEFVLRNAEVRNIFLKYGVDVSVIDCRGRTVLYNALRYAELGYVQHLLESGMSVHHRDSYGETPLHELTRFRNPKFVIPRIKLLLDYGADINAISREVTPLYQAAYQGNLEIVEYLLDAGAIIDFEGAISPIRSAIKSGDIKTAEYLIKRGARLDKTFRGQHGLLGQMMRRMYRSTAKKWQALSFLFENGLTVDPDDYMHLYSNKEREQLDLCQEEFDEMKSTRVCDDHAFTYFDLLVKRGNSLVYHLRNQAIRKNIDAGNYKDWFPTFTLRIKDNVSRGLARLQNLNDAAEILTSILLVLPREIVDMIFKYFDDEELEYFLD